MTALQKVLVGTLLVALAFPLAAFAGGLLRKLVVDPLADVLGLGLGRVTTGLLRRRVQAQPLVRDAVVRRKQVLLLQAHLPRAELLHMLVGASWIEHAPTGLAVLVLSRIVHELLAGRKVLVQVEIGDEACAGELQVEVERRLAENVLNLGISPWTVRLFEKY